jgi:hypothetical protein
MSPRTLEVEEYLPLTPPVFHVLVALADGDKHGYAILKEVADRTAGKVHLSSGTLYASESPQSLMGHKRRFVHR